MKNVCLKIGLIALVLALVFGVALIVLTVNREYAKLHYNQCFRKGSYGYSVGCNNEDCKYCNGQTAHGSVIFTTSRDRYGYAKPVYYEFLFFRIVTGFWVASIVLTAMCGVTAGVMIPLHYKRRKMRRTNKEDY